MKYIVKTATEEIIITARDEANLESKLNFIKSFAKVISVTRLIAIV